MKLGKIDLTKSIKEIFSLAERNGFDLLPILPEHIIMVVDLEFFHRDPFDRLIIAQALSEKFIVVGKDEIFDRYKVNRVCG